MSLSCYSLLHNAVWIVRGSLAGHITEAARICHYNKPFIHFDIFHDLSMVLAVRLCDEIACRETYQRENIEMIQVTLTMIQIQVILKLNPL